MELVTLKSKSSDNAMNYGEEEDDVGDVEDVPLVQQTATTLPPGSSRRPSNVRPSNLIDDDDYETPSTCCRNLIVLGVVWGLFLVFADVQMIFQKRKFNIQPVHKSVANTTTMSSSPSMSPTASK